MVARLIVVWGGAVILDIGILSEDGGLAEEDPTVVHVVVLLRAIVLVGVGVVTKNISLCGRGTWGMRAGLNTICGEVLKG